MSPDDAFNIVLLSPIARVQSLILAYQEQDSIVSKKMIDLLELYNKFLLTTQKDKEELNSIFMDKNKSKQILEDAKIFGDLIYEIILFLGNKEHHEKNDFLRILTV